MKPEDLKKYEFNTPVESILSSYLNCNKKEIIQSLIGDSEISNYDILCYWADVNNTDNSSIIDAIESSLVHPANFVLYREIHKVDSAYSVLRLKNNISLPLEWKISCTNIATDKENPISIKFA
jgi:hypothetical protein